MVAEVVSSADDSSATRRWFGKSCVNAVLAPGTETTKHSQPAFQLLKQFVEFGSFIVGQLDAPPRAPPCRRPSAHSFDSAGTSLLIPLELLFVVSVGGNQGSGQTDLELGSHKEHGWIEIG